MKGRDVAELVRDVKALTSASFSCVDFANEWSLQVVDGIRSRLRGTLLDVSHVHNTSSVGVTRVQNESSGALRIPRSFHGVTVDQGCDVLLFVSFVT